ncbi:NUDIX domain-containing protein [Streptomyces sp. NBC_00481]|uniref:NUDIX domain-containing protein n=1 Tax=Streptomyces sp. NBC_00481 TaxID=2975755 RepID=UPI003FA3CA68
MPAAGSRHDRPSGDVEDDEDPLTTVERELAEEIGRSDPLPPGPWVRAPSEPLPNHATAAP